MFAKHLHTNIMNFTRIVRLSVVIGLVFSAIISLPTYAFATGNWSTARELSMRLKEAGRYNEAYNAAASYNGNSRIARYDKEFVMGWIALRNLNRPDLALNHFTQMVSYIPAFKKEFQVPSKAKAGYWIGRSLKKLGRPNDAKTLFQASMAFTTTYYGQLSASELKIGVTKARLPKSAINEFPVKKLYWHDQRARKELVLAVIREESRFNPKAVSEADAQGLMQVLDSTAKLVGKQAGVKVDVSLMRKNGDYNIAIGSRYLGELLTQYNGNPMLAVAAYNAGPSKADEWIKRFGDPRDKRIDPVDWVENIPYKETREHVQKVMGSYITYLALHQ